MPLKSPVSSYIDLSGMLDGSQVRVLVLFESVGVRMRGVVRLETSRAYVKTLTDGQMVRTCVLTVQKT